MDIESKRTAVLNLLDYVQSHKAIMNMLWVSRTFIWRNKKVIKDTDKPTKSPGQGKK
ncbi:Hypothetical protein FKW44_018814 [Caligus rogercresseyi]|uniref:Uncharacterized protein n=1 Tax=Caligus rogercresseyi TaxID=217165 RepID=A0A7T8GUY1_CALRO|nr:Hypothetical protein FKW44_018814 [Caligus rogercresseyi]